MSEAAVRVEGVTLRYGTGTVALAGVDLVVPPGERLSIVGPSGCGKSTLLRIVAGLVSPSSGRVSVSLDSADSQPMAFVFQEATLLPWRTVRHNVGLPLELRGRGDARAVNDVLARVGLSAFAGNYPRELSGGMRMRVSLARALVTRPRLMLMDEPFAALDDLTRQRLQDDLLALQAADRFTMLFVTHNVVEAAFLADRVVVFSARPGRIVAEQAIPFGSRNAILRSDPDFARACGALSSTLREQIAVGQVA
jgi:NitT/TauT family transport system ATP-binding protein